MKSLSLILCGNALLLAGALAPGAPDVAMRAMVDGFRHIVPEGLDHIAFLLGLFLLARSFHSLLWQVTWFTVAHSLTFGLAMFGLVDAPSRLVEVAVALSIAIVAIENLAGRRLEKWRPAWVSAFGLIHGLAFAHTLQEQPTSADETIPRLFGFNLGIELGQLVVVGTAALLVREWWQREWYRRRIALPGSVALALAGLAWAVGRATA